MLPRLAPVLAVCALICWVEPGQTQPPVKPRLDAVGDPLPEGAIGRIGTLRYRHGGKTLIGFSADRKSVLLHSSGALHYMNVADGAIAKVVRYQDAPADGNEGSRGVQDIALSGDGTTLAYLDLATNAIGIVDIGAGKQTRQIKLKEMFKAGWDTYAAPLHLNHNGKALLIVNNRDNGAPLACVDTTTGQAVHMIAPPKNSSWRQAKFTPDGKHVLALGSGNRLQVLDAGSGKELRSVLLDDQHNNVFFHPCKGGKTLLTWAPADNFKVGDSSGVKLLDYSGKQLKQVQKLGAFDSTSALVLTPDTRYLFLRSHQAISQVELATGKQVQQFDLAAAENEDRFTRAGLGSAAQAGAYGRGLVVSADSKLLAVSGTRAIHLYDIATGKQVNPTVIGSGVVLVRFMPDGNSLAVSTFTLETSLWDLKDMKARHQLATPANFAAPQRSRGFLDLLFCNLAFSHDGKLAAMMLGEKGVEVWDTTGKHLHRLGDDDDNRTFGSAMAFAPKGYLLATSTNGLVRLWDAAAGKELRHWAWHSPKADLRDGDRNEGFLLGLAFSPDGKMLAGCSFSGFERGAQNYLIVWETATGQERLRASNVIELPVSDGIESLFFLSDQLAMTLTYSPDGKTLAMGTITSLHLIDAATGKDVRSYASRACLAKTAVFSKDGSVLFVGRFDGGIRVLETATGKVLRDLAGHLQAVLSLSVSPDGKTLASGSADATVLLWDVAEISKPAAVAKVALTPKDLDTLWSDLAGNDAGQAFQAILKLSASPKEAVPYLAQRLQPVPPPDAKVVAQLFNDLDSPKFQVRDKATLEIDKLGDLALPELLKRLAGKPSLEMRQRMEKLLAKLRDTVTPETLQLLRAVEVLERIGTPEALATLHVLAKGADGHRLTEESRDAIERLTGK